MVNFAVFIKRVLGVSLLVFKLTICVPSGFSRNRCVDPQIQILHTKWTLYQNLIPINVYKCKMTKTTHYEECYEDQRNKPIFTYYDTSNNCRDQSRTKPPLSITEEYHCEISGIKKITETKLVTPETADVNLQTDTLFLSTGFRCRYSLGFCYDSNNEGYAWETNLQGGISCENLIRLDKDDTTAVKFSLDKDYIVFEEGTKALAVELVKQLDLCGGMAWTDNKGFFFTNHTSFRNAWRRRRVDTSLSLLTKQGVYESLLEKCEKGGGVTEFYYYTTIALLAYAILHLACSMYDHCTNCRTFRRERGGSCKWLFQSWINRAFVNKSAVTETKLLSDIEMTNVGREPCPSYYQLRQPNCNDK